MRFICFSAIFAAVFSLLCLPAHAMREVKSASYPAVSADGQTVYFGCWGDIWSAPRDGSAPARRLTDNAAYDQRPLPSPDGKQIAFMSERYGNVDIFVMPADGGEATRLTWYSNTDYLYDWRPDGNAILCYLERQDIWGQCLYELTLDGGAPRRITGPDHDDHVFGSYLGDTEHLIYTRGPGDWAEKRYHGTGAYDLWSYSALSGEHQQLTDYDGCDLWPQPTPDGEFVFFVSDRDGTKNLWKLDMHTGQQTQATRFKDDGPLWPRISSDGDELIFEVFGELWTVDTRGGEPQQVPVYFADDTKELTAREDDFRNRITEYALSPNGRYFAVSVWGDLFLLKNPDEYEDDEKPDQDLSRARVLVSGPGREHQITWHPDGTKIAYASDREGQYEVYTLDLTTLEEKRITHTAVDEAYPDYAPQGEKLAYYSGSLEIRVLDEETGEEYTLYEGHVTGGPWHFGYEWAPDGYWMAVEEQLNDSFTAIKLVNVEDREPRDITQAPDWMSGQTWSPDGKYLAYVWSHEDNTSEVMLLKLTADEETYDMDLLFPEDQPKPEEPEVAEDSDKSGDDGKAKDEGDKKNGKDKDKGDNEDEMEPLKIDFDRIQLRARSISSMAGSASSPRFDPDSEYVIFTTNHDGEDSWWSVEIEDEGETRLTDGSREYPQWSPDGKRLYFKDGGSIVYLNMNGYKSSGSGSVGTTCRLFLDDYRQWEREMTEAWRILDTKFYDSTMGGLDWDAQLKRYLPRIRESGTPEEYGNLMRQMLAETGKSHMGYYSYGNSPSQANDVTASFGVFYDEGFDGPGWKVSKVLPDSPAMRANSRLYPGDVILSLGDTELDAASNRERLLCNQAGLPVTLKVASGDEARQALIAAGEEDPSAEREVVIKPYTINSEGNAKYEMWVAGNREHVYEASHNRIAYQHIRGMNSRYLEQFRRELFTESQGKDALIIDVRFNGGGSTAQDTLNLLELRPSYLRRHHDSDVMGAARQLYYEGPIVVLINSHCFSNSEIFAHIMKDTGKGVLIGETTPGGVISTYDFPLLIGTVRVPAWGNYRLNGEDMEWNGAVPDVYEHIDPQLVAEGGDNQLDAAVEYLLRELGAKD